MPATTSRKPAFTSSIPYCAPKATVITSGSGWKPRPRSIPGAPGAAVARDRGASITCSAYRSATCQDKTDNAVRNARVHVATRDWAAPHSNDQDYPKADPDNGQSRPFGGKRQALFDAVNQKHKPRKSKRGVY
uniref:Uncharacterized protein n=1 Tax=Candidatus Kentrum sp. DK TaxID=2126562 RepID=A0A450TCV2_9GAMM|nr:MAG: hypothetical protein BECKDK2373B_GA0170837_11393 [Candidatus Kentron sp. DK]